MSVVRNWLTPIREKVEYISPDGKVYQLHDPASRAVLSMTGWGVPPVEKATTRGPFQHGRTPLTERVPARTLGVNIMYQRSTREDYLAARTELIDILRYNRSSMDDPQPGFLRWYRADGTIRQADVILSKGPDFDSKHPWDSFTIEENLEFEADNPIIYDPTINALNLSDLGCEFVTQLTFPHSFSSRSLEFGLTFCSNTGSVVIPYRGTFEEFPLISITGPAKDIEITHETTGLVLGLSYTIAAGETVYFDLSYDEKLVYNSFGDSLLGRITSISSLGLWSLLPDPTVTNGDNSVQVAVQDGAGATEIMFSYYNRYLGV
jgi:hypothetical protein